MATLCVACRPKERDAERRGRAFPCGAWERENTTEGKMTNILTDIPGKPGRFWGENTTFIGPNKPSPRMQRLLGKRWAYNLTGILAALRMFARRRHCQGIVTDGGSSGMLFAWLQALCPWGRKPHVLIDCLWELPESRLKAWFKALRIRLA